jgi:hypothetical protein
MDMRRGSGLLSVVVAMAAAFLLATPVRAAPRHTQRMVLPPACYTIQPGASYDASTYCLDKSLPAPAVGEDLADVPAGFGDTRIKLAGSGAVTLQAALAGHLIRIEGLGRDDYDHVRIRNLTGKALEICTTEASVISGDADAPTKDLAVLYPAIRSLATPAEDPASHAAQQEKLWQAVEDHSFDTFWQKLTGTGETSPAPEKGTGGAPEQAGCFSSTAPGHASGPVVSYCPP